MGDFNYIIVWIVFWFAFALFLWNEYKKTALLSVANNDKRNITWALIALIGGALVRTIWLSCPQGIFIDESTGGYDAWCIANYGVDQHLNSYPIYLRAWGSGQSALYAYLAAPFVKIFGLSTPVFRTPMALVGVLSLVIFYKTLCRTQQNTLIVFVLTSFFAINPWHIMKSRWGLDCNICPDLVLIALCIIYLGYTVKKGKLKYYLSGFGIIALSAYGYAASWFALPIICLLTFLFLLKEKQIRVSQLIFSILIILAITFPLIIFAIITVFGGEQMNIGPITIPLLKESRLDGTSIFGSTEKLHLLAQYLKTSAHLIVTGYDNESDWNSLFFWGTHYNIIALPFTIYGFYRIVKNKFENKLDVIFGIWLVSVLPMLFFVEPNINHLNLLWFPLAYFSARGIFFVLYKFPKAWVSALTIILFLCAGFCIQYAYYFNTVRWNGFILKTEQPIKFANTLDVDTIYFDGNRHSITLFYSPISPYIYSATKEIKPGYEDFPIEFMQHYGKYYFYQHEIKPIKRTAYIVYSSQLWNKDISEFESENFGIYTVLWNK